MKEFFNTPYKLVALALILFSVGLGIGSFTYSKFLTNKKNNQSPIINIQTNAYPLPPVIEEERETSKNATRYNFLLMGHGGVGHSGGGLMDSIIVVSVNVTDKKATLISVPRDLSFFGHKINSDPSIKDAITHITGLPIKNTITIDFSNFEKMINSLGGVTVDVKKAYTDNFYPIKGKENELCGFTNEKIEEVHKLYSGFELEKQFDCRYETISYTAGIHDMKGEEALKYVRSRHGGSDFERSRHQFEVLKAILQKGRPESVAEALNFVKTDLSLESLQTLVKEIDNPLEFSVSTIGISDQNLLVSGKSSIGAYILIPKLGENKYDEIKQYIKDNI